MKKHKHMTRAELIRCVKALEKGAPAVSIAFMHERMVHELQVQKAELETQNRELRDAQQLVEVVRDRYADLYDSAPVGYATFDNKGIIREINLTAAGMLGAERTRLVGAPFNLHVAREDLARFREHLARRTNPGERVTTELHLIRKGHCELPVMMQSVIVNGAGTNGWLCRAALTDITERQKAGQALRESAELNRGILSSLSAHIALLDKAGIILAVNDAWNRFAEENGDFSHARTGVGTNYLEICRDATGISTADGEKALQGIRAVLKGTLRGFVMEYPCDSPREKRWFQMSVTPLSAEGRGAVISHWDISERRKSEEALVEQEARLRAVLDTAVDGIITIDERGTIESFNQAAEKLFGFAAHETIGQNISMLMPSPHREAHDRYLANYRDTGERKIIGIGREVLGLRKDGTLFPVGLTVNEAQLAGRRIFTGFVRDLTRRKHAEEALRTSEARFRSLSEASPLGICLSDALGQCTYTNPRWQEMSGLSAEKNLGDGWTRIIHPKDRKDLFNAWNEAVRTKQEFVWEFRILRPDGVTRWIRARTKPIVDADGRTTSYVGVDEDITEHRREELRRRLLYETSRVLAASDSVTGTVSMLLKVVVEAFEWDVGEFWEVSGNTEKLRVVHVWHAPGRKLAAFVRHSLKISFSMFDGLPGRVMSTRKPDWIPEIAECPHFGRKQAAARAGLHSALAFPILVNNHALGVMAFLTHGVTEPDEDLLQLFASLGSQIGQFMERKKTEEALREANEFGKQVFEGAEAGIVVYDREGRFLVWNPFMEQLSGYRAEEVLGRTTLEMLPFLREQGFEKMFQRALSGEIFEGADTPFDVPEKQKKGWKVERFSPWRDSRKEIVGVIVAVRDITERKRLENEILEISEREQRKFGRDVHDGLGQRLTGLEMLSHSLVQELERHAPALVESAERLNRELRETVTQARLISHSLAPVPLEGDGLMRGLMELAASTNRIPGVSCRFFCNPPVQIQDVTTATHLYRIAQEAVNNALKHGRAKTIDITLEEQTNGVELTVNNNGRSMPKNNCANVGTGVNAMRYRAEMIGGRLAIESGKRKGVKVTCTLPRNS